MERFGFEGIPLFEMLVSNVQSAEEKSAQSEAKFKNVSEKAEMIVADTSSVVHPAFPLMMEHKNRQCPDQPICVFVSSVKELKKHIENPKKPEEFRRRCEERLHQMTKWTQEGQIRILGRRADRVFADPKLVQEVVWWRHRVDSILIITNDYSLSDDLQNMQVEDSGTICTVQINRYGYFSQIPPVSRRAGGTQSYRGGNENVQA